VGSILFITAQNTGGGHTSITRAVTARLERLRPGLTLAEVDGFSLGGGYTDAAGRMYNAVATFAPHLWGTIYAMGNLFVRPFNVFTARTIRKRLAAKLAETDPDLIVTVHPCYVGSVLNVLHSLGRDIPVVAIVADLDNVSYLWADPRTTLTLCPTKESYATMRKRGVPEERLALTGFPVRDAFSSVPVEAAGPGDVAGRPIRFLLMSGSQGGFKTGAVAALLLRLFDCHVTIIAGRDRLLKQTLEANMVPRHGDRLAVRGFVDDVERYMLESDVLLLRASPNTLMEAVTLCKPVIVIGSFSGQEARNPEFAEREHLGVRCNTLRDLPRTVSDLIADGGAKLQEIRDSEWRYRRPEAASDIAASIIRVMDGGDIR
jgi:UDP-N-acetylglucosamine:LPS N-acetylglucosamine transferase